MKILAVSDRVVPYLYTSDVKEKYGDVDYVFGCGDLPFYYLEFLHSALDARVFYVRGNHDQSPQYTSDGRVLRHVQGGVDLHTRAVYIKGLLVAGLEGSMRYRPNTPHMYTESEMRRQIYGLLPALVWNRVRYGRPVDVLITHSPPFGIHDQPDLPHTGFKVFLNLLKLAEPKLMIHGHVHLYKKKNQFSRFGNTTIVNVYPSFVFQAFPDPAGHQVKFDLTR